MQDSPTDEQLVIHAQEDTEAFAQLYRRHVRRIYAYLYSRVGNKAEAEDLTSQTFVTALEKLSTYHPNGSFGGWLTKIARNKAIDAYRKNKPIIAFAEINLSTPIDSVEVAISKKLQLDDIQHALNQMNAERADALRLRIFGELSHAEIGAILDKSEGAAKTIVWRAMNDLRAYFNTDKAQEARTYE